jgi:hypothetical protein
LLPRHAGLLHKGTDIVLAQARTQTLSSQPGAPPGSGRDAVSSQTTPVGA